LGIGYWVLVIGYWLLGIGYWVLVLGAWCLVLGISFSPGKDNKSFLHNILIFP
jgi:hypothetical protein